MKLASKNSQVLVEISGTPIPLLAARDWSINCERGTIDVSTISTEWKEFLSGQISASGSVTLLYDPDNEAGDAAIEDAMMAGTPLVIYMRPEGSKVGGVQFKLPVFVTSWNLSAATDDALAISVSFSGAGPMVKGVVSA